MPTPIDRKSHRLRILDNFFTHDFEAKYIRADQFFLSEVNFWASINKLSYLRFFRLSASAILKFQKLNLAVAGTFFMKNFFVPKLWPLSSLQSARKLLMPLSGGTKCSSLLLSLIPKSVHLQVLQNVPKKD